MKKNLFLLLILIFLTSCGSAGFTLKKETSSDEFLVEKKSPLVLPPNYGELPLPDSNNISNDQTETDNFKTILGDNKKEAPRKDKNSKSTSIENSILEKIK